MNDFTPFLTTPLAHRGLHDGVYPENSLGAFKQAIEHGYGIELDVHPLKDGGVVVFHDLTLTRVCGHDLNVELLSTPQLKEYRLGDSNETIPTLEEVLSLVDGKVPLLIELKIEGKFNPELPDRVIKILENYNHPEMIAIQSFNPYAIKHLRKTYPHRFKYGQLTSHLLEGQSNFVHFMFRSLLVTMISKPDFLAVDVKFLPNKPIKRKRKKGMPVITWTINTEEYKKVAFANTDNIIFEKIDPSH